MVAILLKAALFVPLFATSVAANCAGFNYAIGNVIRLSHGINRWNVYDNNCKVVDSLTTTLNPCIQGTFGCSPAPILFEEYKNTFTGLIYVCSTDPSSGVCGDDVISVCCRNYGL